MSGYAKSKYVDEAPAKESDSTGNIIIYTLLGLCILLSLFIVIGFFVIAKPLEASLKSVAVTSLRYNDASSSSSPYFNATLAMEVRIENPNFGFFEFPASKGNIWYNGRVVGEMKINGQRVGAYSATRTEVVTQVSYREDHAPSVWFKNDIKRGLIVLKVGAKLRGEVNLEVLNKRSVNLKCLMHLNLIDGVIQRLWCK
ncbi:Late embryogenesis abundant (LEA) hydroxyproline-rich glycoprotein family [Raphanus sativus]|uniref:Late embryogenesis abundant protein At1g64065 n=1 Tax=Raphanus sativus TaxID=3726 RepID=A0A6J0JR62_RAPSA|nr:late embryogenesis abundant protein At1g64065 [Raphanus sativus]KAJ4892270.1 Late embryogenesis abundant (LEA) hydroxyproline-rich glycoprotein family [Raphanus sativus]